MENARLPFIIKISCLIKVIRQMWQHMAIMRKYLFFCRLFGHKMFLMVSLMTTLMALTYRQQWMLWIKKNWTGNRLDNFFLFWFIVFDTLFCLESKIQLELELKFNLNQRLRSHSASNSTLWHLCFDYDWLCENFKPLYLDPQSSIAEMDSTFIWQPYMIYLPAKFHSEVPFSLEIGPL